MNRIYETSIPYYYYYECASSRALTKALRLSWTIKCWVLVIRPYWMLVLLGGRQKTLPKYLQRCRHLLMLELWIEASVYIELNTKNSFSAIESHEITIDSENRICYNVVCSSYNNIAHKCWRFFWKVCLISNFESSLWPIIGVLKRLIN